MTYEDPFFLVKEEVQKALSKTVNLYHRWNDLQAEPLTLNLLKEEIEWTSTELRNSLRSIEWDLEDLEDTIGIVEKNSNKFKIDVNELSRRKKFIEDTRVEVKVIYEYYLPTECLKSISRSGLASDWEADDFCMREKLSYSRPLDIDKTSRQPITETLTTVKMVGGRAHSSAKYSKLENQIDSPERTQFLRTNNMVQNQMIHDQDDQVELISNSLGTLKNMSRQIGIELDEQDEMLNELHHEIEQTDSRIDSTMKKVAKVLHLSNDRSQWIAIGVLSGLLMIILVLFIAL